MPQASAEGGNKPRLRSPAVVIPRSSVADEGHFPRHYDQAWSHAVPRVTEGEALKSLKAASKAQQHDAHLKDSYRSEKTPLYIEATDYEIYTKPENNFIGELHSLDYMDVAGKKLLFSGVLSVGSTRHYAQGIPVKSYSIEGYGVDDKPNATVYIVSSEAGNDRTHDIWYRLGAPSRQYKRFQDAFLWIATLGKHVIDYLEYRQGVTLADFRQTFNEWLLQRFPGNPDISKWRKAYGSTDFRKIIHAYISYLWSEAMCLQDDSLLDHPLWKQCGRTDDGMIEPKCKKTVATPHVYKCFKNRYFAGQITEMQPSEAVLSGRENRIKALELPSEVCPVSSGAIRRLSQNRNTVEAGDVVCIAPDEFENQMWRKKAKDSTAVHEWIGYVQRVTPLSNGRQRLYVIWLYRPEDTTISTTDYPVTKELFMSDNCNCQEHALVSSEVTRHCSVEWFSRSYNTRKEFLVRQKYETGTSSFVTMKETDFRCTCQSSHPNPTRITSYRQGDTVYVRENDVLEPVVVEELNTMEKQVTIRRLQRLCMIGPETACDTSQRRIAANELVWTDTFERVARSSIEGRCYVRFFKHEDIAASRVRFPYDQGGTGHCWILSMRVGSDRQTLEDLSTAPQHLREGPEYAPKESSNKLPGLSLFSGLGNLDKGLEAGGAVHFHTSVDMNGRAIQTLRANADDPDQLKLWFGSVDDYLHALLSGDSPNMNLVAKIGDVGVIAGGSPCPGFSKLQQNWLSEQSLRNAAHVTTFASFVDVYRPEYGFLENVVNMGVTRKGFEEELVLSQLIGCLVSMGYQVQQFIMSSWHYGSPQHRNRLILSIAAPGRTPLAPPRATHGDPDGFKSKSVGKLLNGERFGVQDAQVTPFLQHVTPGEKLGHLPNIGCGIRHPCISSPDHVLRCRPNIRERRCMAHVPTDPPGVGIEYAAKRGLVPKYLYETRSEISSKSYRRINKNGLIGTIVTAPSPHDSRAGPFVHWEQNRCITLEEARLAQDIPAEEVLIGNVNDQYKMVGNAVDRRVSKALGLELRRAVDRDANAHVHPSNTATMSRNSTQDAELEAQLEREFGFDLLVKPGWDVGEDHVIAEFDNPPPTLAMNHHGFPGHLSKALSAALLCQRSSGAALQPSTSATPELQVRTKRSRDQSKADSYDRKSSRSRPSLKKRVKDSGEPTGLNSRVSVGPTKVGNTTELGKQGDASRKTRHSGLGLEFVPQSWHRMVEKDIKANSKVIKKPKPRPYA
ncbi:S-adenosyl-L-methionine-dependent methyltransferase [Karstenula rhodostoma CBS 690.94]|uniref:DNA (cytosine-5-)-methyltransferase n=1 Tax=Karstenula rhodostoma CBS 690.94 TaxID=1392251 RepID=A0A9P4PIV4_9PLEO|nr:S-adenosyl-L-methionine-dependent methyltransferase [Karstenula rhodostoma CBS 690.94]